MHIKLLRVGWPDLCNYISQLYFDFSGYSDLTIGIGKMMGFVFRFLSYIHIKTNIYLHNMGNTVEHIHNVVGNQAPSGMTPDYILALGLAAGSLILSLIVFFKSYGIKRSEYVTTKRFDKEIESIQDLSEKLLVLIQATKDHKFSNSKTIVTDKSWEEAASDALSSLGKAAPFLNYLDTSASCEIFCGVARKDCKGTTQKIDSQLDSQECDYSVQEYCCKLRNQQNDFSKSCHESKLAMIQSESNISLFYYQQKK